MKTYLINGFIVYRHYGLTVRTFTLLEGRVSRLKKGGLLDESIDFIIDLHGFICPRHAIKTSNYFSQRYSIRSD